MRKSLVFFLSYSIGFYPIPPHYKNLIREMNFN